MEEYNRNHIPLASKLRKNMTPWERKLWYEFLCRYPVRFQRQKAIGQYIVDFYCACAGLVIEVDGSQHYEKTGKEEDAARDEYLSSLGLLIKRYSNREIHTQFQNVQ